jgi:hypothetical protein
VVNKSLVHFVLLLIVEASSVVLVLAGINFYILPHNAYVRVYDWFFFEGIFCLIFGVLFALGRGGIDRYTLGSATTRAATDAIYGTDYGVSTAFRKDKWKPKGFPKAALVLLVSGLIMLIIYFLTF